MPEDRALYPELKITVQNDGTVEAEVGGKPPADDGIICKDELLRETLTTFRDWLSRGKINIEYESELALFGKLLHSLLFRDGGSKIRDLVYTTMKEARDSKTPIRLQLAFKHKQAELASLPWEFLYDPDNQSFFATANELILTRFVTGSEARQALLSNKFPLRMLIVVSTRGGKSVASEDTVKAIQNFADANPTLITLDKPLIDPTILQLQEWLEVVQNRPQIIHFIGHGQYNKSNNWGEIALAKMDESGEADWIDQNRFKTLFKNAGCIPRLLFLQLCEGAVVKKGELIASFEGLAPVLIEANVQAVVAMQFPIKNVHAGRISVRFYDELTKGRSVGEAVTAARRMTWLIDPVAGGTPVLYMYGYDGPIVPNENTQSQTRGGAMTGSSQTGATTVPSTVPESAPLPKTKQSESSEQSSSPRSVAPQSTNLDRILEVGAMKIKEITQGHPVIQGVQAWELPDESFLLNKKLYAEVAPTLQGKTIAEVRLILAVLSQREANSSFGTVLGAMFNSSLTTSSDQLNQVLAAGIRKIVDLALGDPAAEKSDSTVALNQELHVELLPQLDGKTVSEMKIVLGEFFQSKAGTPLCPVLDAMLAVSTSLS